jgi:hypothetical protein
MPEEGSPDPGRLTEISARPSQDLQIPHFRCLFSVGSNFARVNYFEGALKPQYEAICIWELPEQQNYAEKSE